MWLNAYGFLMEKKKKQERALIDFHMNMDCLKLPSESSFVRPSLIRFCFIRASPSRWNTHSVSMTWQSKEENPPFFGRDAFWLVFFSADFFYVSIMLTENEWWRNEDTNGTMLISHTIQMKDDQHRGTGFVVKIERERERTYIRQMDKW